MQSDRRSQGPQREIDLTRFRDAELRIYSGRDSGESARRSIGLDQLDTDPTVDRVTIHVPEDTWAVTSSFWMGLFGASVRRLRRHGFRCRYEFTGGIAQEDVDAGIEDALQEENPLAIYGFSPLQPCR